MRHLVRDVSQVLTLFLASRQVWPKKIFGGGKFPPKRCLDKTLGNRGICGRSMKFVSVELHESIMWSGEEAACNRDQGTKPP